MKEILESLEFTPYEAEIYLCLLEHGKLSAYEIAEKTGLYRQAAYDALNRLLEKGNVTNLKEGRRKIFKAVDPTFLLEQQKEKERNLQAILPQLFSLKKTGEDAVEVEVFKGRNVLRLCFTDAIKVLKKFPGELCCTAVDESFFIDYDAAAMEYYKREMLRHGFTERVIIKRGTKGYFPRKMSTYRTIPPRFFNSHPIQIYGNTVQLHIEGNPQHMILIRSQSVADSFRKQFELMWKVAKPLKK
ncbi:MAG: hypothetical protein OXR66_06495 [Candidatus Woesearchaeota archaeon]|nr:hypothetical protein [Candidatus Woesearchaeota archaeon]